MKTTELRIGNYLMGGNGPVKIISIPDDISVNIGKGDPYLVHTEPPYKPCLSPISLTEEWFLKLGLKHNQDVKFTVQIYPAFCEHTRSRIKFYSVDTKTYILRINDTDICELQYVHQLQNLYFALTGNELNIK
jgi:hypothetical protein